MFNTENTLITDPLLEMYIFEVHQLIEQLEPLLIDLEKTNALEFTINEIFRIMHTIKGSSAMMLFNNISSLAHSIEDVFHFLRENKLIDADYSKLTDIILESTDFIRNEVSKIETGKILNGDPSSHILSLADFLSSIQSKIDSINKEKTSAAGKVNRSEILDDISSSDKIPSLYKFKACIFFDEGCEMENIRAFTVINNIKDIVNVIEYSPKDILENEKSSEVIKIKGFQIILHSDLGIQNIRELLEGTAFLKELKLEILNENSFNFDIEVTKPEVIEDFSVMVSEKQKNSANEMGIKSSASKQPLISVSVSKMDMLMDLVGELVISEAMVTQNSDLNELNLENFNKAARQLKKITNELQGIVMSIRMVPLGPTFQKMNRIVRDISKKLNKEVELSIKGQETEMDKNIIERISDPLMHLIRNSLDHGIEPAEERLSKGKPSIGSIKLEAKSAGGDVWIIIKDDGQGLDKSKIYKKAFESGLTNKSENELTDKEIYSYILLPGFSTKDTISEFSGRGVGMDIVSKNIESVGGRLIIDSTFGKGTTISIKIPLTLAIIDGMNVKVGNSTYTIPITSIKESIRVKESNIIKDIDNNEMIMLRGECFPVIRLHEVFNVETEVKQLINGIIMMVESESKSMGIFIDALIGEQSVVVKALPQYFKRVRGIAGCALLSDGNISLILDIAGLIN